MLPAVNSPSKKTENHLLKSKEKALRISVWLLMKEEHFLHEELHILNVSCYFPVEGMTAMTVME